jgi:hypothetical protein
MLPLPFLNGVFVLVTFICVWMFYRASGRSRQVLLVSCGWLILQAGVTLTGFYRDFNTLPPRILFALIPALLFIAGLFFTSKGRAFLDSLNPAWLTYLHAVRIPVEIVLLLLFLEGLIPEVMTFEGRNFDILAGLSAPFVAIYGYVKKTIGRTGLLIWNFVCIGLLVNIVTTAVLSAPFPFQQLAFDQPNMAVFYYPFIWLPAFIVPIVLLAHLAVIRQLFRTTVTA